MPTDILTLSQKFRKERIQKAYEYLHRTSLTKLSTYGICYKPGAEVEYKLSLYENQVCHARLFSRPDGFQTRRGDKLDFILTRISENRVDPKAGKRYLKWVLQDSIFASCFFTKSPKLAIERGIRMKLDVPNNMFLIALTAARQSYEDHYERDIVAWDRLTKRGVDPYLAFCLIGHVRINKGGYYRLKHDYMIHCCIDVDIKTNDIVLFLKEGVKPSLSTYREKPFPGTVVQSSFKRTVGPFFFDNEKLRDCFAKKHTYLCPWSGFRETSYGAEEETLVKYLIKFQEEIR